MSERLLTAADLGDRPALSTSTALDWFEAVGYRARARASCAFS